MNDAAPTLQTFRSAMLAVFLAGGLAGLARAQDAVTAAPGSIAAGPVPWYLGAGQGFTHSSNVYNVPSGPGDTWSSTSLLAGFDQPISRQRVFGNATVGLNRYFDQKQLDNTSYNLATGLVWETIARLSGDVNAGLDQSLAAPSASAGTPTARRNLARNQTFDAHARWGGTSLLTIEAGYDHSRLDFSAPEYITSEVRRDSSSLAVFLRPGGPVRLGIGVRADRTLTPNAILAAQGGYEGNTVDGRYLDLYADYAVPSVFSVTSRLSYARQRNTSLEAADFSGPTGRVGINLQPSGRITVNAYAARDVGFDLGRGTGIVNAAPGSGVGTGTGSGSGSGAGTPVIAAYENNRITYSAELGATYLATAKIMVSGGARYSRAKLLTTAGAIAGGAGLADSTDVGRSLYLGATYDIQRNWMASCNLSHETRSVSGGVGYAYGVNTVGCSTRYLWR